MRKIILLPAILFLWWGIAGCSRQAVDEYAMITFMIGDVKKNNVEAQIGDIIKENDSITTASDSFCDIKIGGSIIRIKAQTNLKISTLVRKGDMENTTLGLTGGKMLCKPKKLLKSESFMVKTPTAVAGVRGTQFAVETDKLNTTRIKAFTGEVKVAKRIKQLESSVEKVLAIAPAVQKEEKVVITADEVKKAEKVVEASLKKETARGTASDKVIENVIKNTMKDVVVDDKAIEKFQAADFTKENREIIAVQEKPREVIVRIATVIKEEKEKPKPEGRLLITRYDIYFIKEGKIMWEGRLVNEPVKQDNRLYVASGDYVFCAQLDGPVLWRKNIKNDGNVRITDGKIVLKADGKDVPLDPDTGEKL